MEALATIELTILSLHSPDPALAARVRRHRPEGTRRNNEQRLRRDIEQPQAELLNPSLTGRRVLESRALGTRVRIPLMADSNEARATRSELTERQEEIGSLSTYNDALEILCSPDFTGNASQCDL
jgi:hypothetical protein